MLCLKMLTYVYSIHTNIHFRQKFVFVYLSLLNIKYPFLYNKAFAVNILVNQKFDKLVICAG